MFNALVLNQEDKRTIANIEQIDETQLPEGDVLIDVDYSSLNYKDGLAITGKVKSSATSQWYQALIQRVRS